MSEDRRLAQSTAAWSGAGDDASPAIGDAPTVDGRPPAVRGTAGQVLADGRYQLLGELGRGGMAVVHAAFDRQLGRRVALKLVRPDRVDATGRARLLREAQAMARLHHRNVVQVFDAGSAGDHVFVAMELVDGGSLHRWLVTAPRSWRQIVELFVGAGRGLAAAHAAGLVHRDFKPDNVLIDAHGVARVADFGLAIAGADHEPTDGTAGALASVTSTGVLIGTPAYMAPEQLDGEPATAAADQFAFCVALHRALHGIAPFAGETPTALRERIGAGAPDESEAGRALPRWLRAAVARGLAIRPADRHPSMDALLDVLARPRGWRKWRVPLIGGVAVVASATAIVLAASGPAQPDPAAACDGGRDELAAVWSPARQAAVVQGLDTASAEVRDLVLGTLKRQAQAWTTMHRRACVAHARGSESEQTLDRRMRCLRQRRIELDAALDALTGIDRAERRRAVDVTANLAPIDDCGDLELLARELPPPASPEVRRTSDSLRHELARLEAVDRTGRSESALAGIDALLPRIREVNDPALLVDALLVRGRILQVRTEVAKATTALSEAERIALANGAVRAAVEAGARRLFVEAMDGQRLDALSAQAELLEPLAQSLTSDRFAVPLLLNNLGAMHMARGDTAKARGYFERAKALVDAIPEPRLELLVVDRNLALTAGGAVSERLAQQTLSKLRQRLGADNPTTIEAATTASHLTRDPREALALADDAIARTAELQPAAIEMRLTEARYAAFLASELSDGTRQRSYLVPVVALWMTDATPVIVAIHQLAVADLALLDGDLDAARDAYVAADRVLLGSPNWWDREFGAAGLVGLATIAQRRGDDRTAMRQLDEAIAVYVDTVAKGNNQDPMRRLARARVMRAELARAHGDVDLARRLEAAALEYYRSTNAVAYARIIVRLAAATQLPQPPP